jgi:hypothetical protein
VSATCTAPVVIIRRGGVPTALPNDMRIVAAVARKATCVALITAALVLDPMATFKDPDPPLTFGEPEMRAAVEGTWELIDGDQHERLVITEASKVGHSSRGWIKRAAACGKRSFVRSAHACVDMTRMELDVRLAGTHRHGALVVEGANFRAAELTVDLGLRGLVDVRITPHGEVTKSYGRGTLRRIERG